MENDKHNDPEKGKKKPGIQLTELFMAKAGQGSKGFDRCFTGIIKREKDDTGNDIVISIIKVNDGTIWAQESDQQILGNNLDWMVEAILDFGLHSDPGVYRNLCQQKFFMN